MLIKNPIWHIHKGKVPEYTQVVSYAMLLNLASVCNADTADILWGFISKYTKDNNKSDPLMNNLIVKALQYYKDFIAPNKKYIMPNAQIAGWMPSSDFGRSFFKDPYALASVGLRHGIRLRPALQMV